MQGQGQIILPFPAIILFLFSPGGLKEFKSNFEVVECRLIGY
jgi:hypothetical protein